MDSPTRIVMELDVPVEFYHDDGYCEVAAFSNEPFTKGVQFQFTHKTDEQDIKLLSDGPYFEIISGEPEQSKSVAQGYCSKFEYTPDFPKGFKVVLIDKNKHDLEYELVINTAPSHISKTILNLFEKWNNYIPIKLRGE